MGATDEKEMCRGGVGMVSHRHPTVDILYVRYNLEHAYSFLAENITRNFPVECL